MGADFVFTLIGLALSAVSVVIAYLQLKHQILSSMSSIARQDVANNSSAIAIKYIAAYTSLAANFTIFAPMARIKGIAANFVNRSSELGLLRKCLLQRKSLVVVEGIPGIGKTALVAAFCQSRLLRFMGYQIGWAFCSERQVNLKSLALAIGVLSKYLPEKSGINRILMENVETEQLSDIIIDCKKKQKLIIILDDYHKISDKEMHKFIQKVARSKLRSMVIITSNIHPEFIEKLRTIEIIRLNGLKEKDGIEFLRSYGIDIDRERLRQIWERAKGVPEAMRILAGLVKARPELKVLEEEPYIYETNLSKWISDLVSSVSYDELKILKFCAFFNESVTLDLLNYVFSYQPIQVITSLQDKFLVNYSGSYISVHPLIRDYIFEQISDKERQEFSQIITKYFKYKARDLLLGVKEEPSYGRAYLEAHPEYVQDEARHIRFVDSLFERLQENGFVLHPGARILVLGAGHGTHDAAFAKYGLQIVNVELLKEVADIGYERSKKLNAFITYLIADMTKNLGIKSNCIDAVFNIGSSFGFEDEDAKNIMIFKNAARVLKHGRPFVFEYVNGNYWSKRVSQDIERDIEVRQLPNRSVRIKFKIFNPIENTSLDIITLQRPDNSKIKFFHFMRYYKLEEVKNMMSQAGLKVIAVYGSPEGEPFDSEKSPSMVIIAVKY